MWGHPAKKLKQFRARATLFALVGLAFAVGVGVGALAVTARMAEARASVPAWGDPTADLVAGLEASPAEYEAALFRAQVVAASAAAAASDVHTVASALTVQLPTATGPLYDVAAVARMVPGERSAAYLTFYYCSGAFVGDGGGFCGSAADGTPVQMGVAACDRAHHGQRFRVVGDPTGLVFRCADTGSGVAGQHRDIWFPTPDEAAAWFAHVGHSVMIQVLE
ncbi:MAG: hypothetical protein IT299_04935 [Dehalococcoidia bacterium]|nr:hypothetical protein [Dehalococcoidia bacterium]